MGTSFEDSSDIKLVMKGWSLREECHPCATGIVQCCMAGCLLVFGQRMQLLAWNLCECSSQAKTFEEECLGLSLEPPTLQMCRAKGRTDGHVVRSHFGTRCQCCFSCQHFVSTLQFNANHEVLDFIMSLVVAQFEADTVRSFESWHQNDCNILEATDPWTLR